MPDLVSHLGQHWPSVAVATLAMLLVRVLWFSPLLFQRAWTRHSSIRPTDWRRHEKRTLTIIQLLVQAVIATLISLVASHVEAHPALLFAAMAVIWAVVMLEELSGVLWRREPISIFFLFSLRSLSVYMTGALVFYLWSFL
jgi:hypothetical protein